MKRRRIINRFGSLTTAAVLAANLALGISVPAAAENFLFITDIRVAAGADAEAALEKAGYSVMVAGLNTGVSEENQVYLGYKLNAGDPVTNIVISEDVGESFTSGEGFVYDRAGSADVDEGNGGGAGCVYFTRDPGAGEALVGLDILRADSEKDEVLYAIPNDGSEVVQNADGKPADLETGSKTITMYLAQIRDGLVRPYISEVAVVSGDSKRACINKAAKNGYNYYVEGDIDVSKDTYTILAYLRTADPGEAITNLTAVTAEMAQYLEDTQFVAGIGSQAQTDMEEPADQTEEVTETEPEEDTEEAAAEPDVTEEEEAETEAEAAEEETLEETVIEAEGEVSEEVSAEAETSEETVIETEEETSGEEGASEETAAETEETAGESAEDETVTDPEGSAEETESAEEQVSEEDAEESTEETIPDDTEEEPAAEEEEASSEEPGEEPAADDREKMTAKALEISGVEYIRVSSRQIAGEQPYYLYMTKDSWAGNPISMIYAGNDTDTAECLFGRWAYSYFTSPGRSSAYSYIVNEDLLTEIGESMEVYVDLPVTLLTLSGEEDPYAYDVTPQQEPLTVSMLTAKEGLPEGRYVISGMIEPTYDPPMLEREEAENNEENEQPASAFKDDKVSGIIIAGIAVIAAGAGSAATVARKRKKTAKADGGTDSESKTSK